MGKSDESSADELVSAGEPLVSAAGEPLVSRSSAGRPVDPTSADGPAHRRPLERAPEAPDDRRPLDRHPCGQREPIATARFSRASIPQVRRLTATAAKRARLDRTRCQELVLAIDELATNSVVHGGGRGELALWPTAEGILCEVRDNGHISDPLVVARSARPPRADQLGGRGLWVAGQLCDRLEIASAPGRTVVRVHMKRH